MASSKPSTLVLKEPEAERRPGANGAIASLVNSVADTPAPETIASTQPMRFHVDGEPIEGGTELQVRVHPAALRVVVR